MLAPILLVLAGLIGLVLLVAAFRPAAFCVARCTTIAAPAAVVFDYVNDLRAYRRWDPWSKLDPTTVHRHSGADSGPGATLAWSGRKTGVGSMTITDSRPGELVRMRLDFLKPFTVTNTIDFTFRPEGDRTVTTWSMSGMNNFMFRVIGLFMSTDKMCGPQFESGLADLKSLAETAARNSSPVKEASN
jgi:uncharacterized protein YndB with AHSA1/START domain